MFAVERAAHIDEEGAVHIILVCEVASHSIQLICSQEHPCHAVSDQLKTLWRWGDSPLKFRSSLSLSLSINFKPVLQSCSTPNDQNYTGVLLKRLRSISALQSEVGKAKTSFSCCTVTSPSAASGSSYLSSAAHSPAAASSCNRATFYKRS